MRNDQFVPESRLTLTFPALAEPFLESPPVFWHTLGLDAAASSQADYGADNGGASPRVERESGEIHSAPVVDYQDTYKTGTGGLTGIPFTVLAGTWRDDAYDPVTGKRRLLMEDSTPGTQCAVQETTARPFRNRFFRIERGLPAGTVARSQVAEIYTVLTFNVFGSQGQWRLVCRFNAPVALQYRANDSDSWRTVDSKDFWRPQGAFVLEVELKLDRERKRVTVECNVDGRTFSLLHAKPPTGKAGTPWDYSAEPLPATAQCGLALRGGWGGFSVCDFNYPPVTVRTDPLPPPSPAPPTGGATAFLNTLGENAVEGGYSYAASLVQQSDGTYRTETTVSRSDPKEPIRFTDILIYIPARFTSFTSAKIPTLTEFPVRQSLRWTMDDDNHLIYCSGELAFPNTNGQYRGSYGHFATWIDSGNGDRFGRRAYGLFGVGKEGIEIVTTPQGSEMRGKFWDWTYKLRQPLCNRYVFDGWDLRAAVYTLLVAGGVHPARIQWTNPGPPPYGASVGLFTPILGRGLGNNPRFDFDPKQEILAALLGLLEDHGPPSGLTPETAKSTPYYLYQDAQGNFHLWAYDAATFTASRFYTTGASDDPYQTLTGSLKVTTDATSLRTEMNLMGLDAWTNQLLYYHEPLNWNRMTVGFRSPFLERSARFVSQGALVAAARTLRNQASNSEEWVFFQALYDPFLFPGMKILVEDYESLKGVKSYIVKEVVEDLSVDTQSGQQAALMTVAARGELSDMVF